MAASDSPKTVGVAPKIVQKSLISVAGLVGRPVYHNDGEEVGVVVDIVCQWNQHQAYPEVTGIVARVGRRNSWIAASNVHDIKRDSVTLSTSRLDLRDFKAREGEARLMREVVDHQVIDVNGVRVIRAADLYLGQVAGTYRLVGVDTSFGALLRRLGPRALRYRSSPKALIDWSTIQSFGDQAESGRRIQAGTSIRELKRLRPGELADLLEDLGRNERQELLDALGPEEAANALEEMQPEELETLLRESSAEDAAILLSNMEPDEAADALRDLTDEEQTEIMAHLSKDIAQKLRRVLSHDEDEAGGLMTTAFMRATEGETVAGIRRRLLAGSTDVIEVGDLIVVDDAGRLVEDISMAELFVAEPDQKVGELAGKTEPVTVHSNTGIKELTDLLIESRNSSIVVVDDEGRPIGRILADDVIDALVPEEGKFHFPRIFG